jgi:hypothetical protein
VVERKIVDASGYGILSVDELRKSLMQSELNQLFISFFQFRN